MNKTFKEILELATELGFVESPVVQQNGDVISVSITTGDITRFSNGDTSLIAALGPGSNGACVDGDGGIYIAHNGGRWAHSGPSWEPSRAGGVYKIDQMGQTIWFTSDPISPNDICFGPDGMLYVTDPTRAQEGNDGRIWRIHPVTGAAELLCSVPWFPNGLAFCPNNSLYVASTMEQRIYRFPGILSNHTEAVSVIEMEEGYPDGVIFDENGDLIVCAISLEEAVPGTLQTWSTKGELLWTMTPGMSTKYTNAALTADKRIIIADSDGGRLLVASWPVAGLPLHSPTFNDLKLEETNV